MAFTVNRQNIKEAVGMKVTFLSEKKHHKEHFFDKIWLFLHELMSSFFFNCYLAAPRPTLGHYRGDSLTHPMLITAFYIFDPKVTGSLVTRLGP